MRLFPAIDLKDGRCVRLLRGDFAQQTAYPTAPLELARKFEAMGADWLHVVDLDGARQGCADQGNRVVIAQLARESSLRLQVGGGLRTRTDVERVLEAGAARAVVGSAALSDPAAVRNGSMTSAAIASPSPSTCVWMRAARRASPRTAGSDNRAARCGKRSPTFPAPPPRTCCAPTSAVTAR